MDTLELEQTTTNSFELFDVVRIDHFKRFLSTGEFRSRKQQSGNGLEVPGYDLFKEAVKEQLGGPLNYHRRRFHG